MKVLVTGAGGFIGWHTLIRLRALTDHDLVPVTRANWHELSDLARGCEAVIHIAGVNRANDSELREGNAQLAREVTEALKGANSVKRLVYANSVQADNESPYGQGKDLARRILLAGAQQAGAEFVDILLPNVFGEHGTPNYNSFVATFVAAAIEGDRPEIVDRDIALLHAQEAAAVLIEALTTSQSQIRPQGTPTTILDVWHTLENFFALYKGGDIPPLLTRSDLHLFNTLRSAMFPTHYPFILKVNADPRGELIETVRVHGGQGQTFISSTNPGFTRGEHYHLAKVERFVVIGGEARISLRKLYSDEKAHFDVSGSRPCAIDMPMGWVHNITNVGSSPLVTQFWTHELYNPAAPDTFPEKVQ